MDSELVVSILERKGWRVSPVSGGWRCDRAGLPPSMLGMTPSWICLRQPVTGWQGRDTAGTRSADHLALLKRNEAMFLARHALDSALNPVLLVDLPRFASVPMLDRALDALARYADLAQAQAGVQKSGTGHEDWLTQETPGLAHETVAYYVRAVEGYGWGLRAKPSGMTWPLGYKGQRVFDVFFSVSPAWAYFQVPMLPGVPAALSSRDDAVRAAFLRYLLRVNDAWYMAKLGLTAAGQPIMMLEVPTQELDFDLFRLCTRMIASYLDFYSRELQIMAELERDHKLRAWVLAG